MAANSSDNTDTSTDVETKPDSGSPLRKAIGQLGLRSIGPALMGGRIADIAVHPDRPSTWYLAVGSGGVWKTTNAGTTWQPIFDEQPSYSIGCITLDPSNPEVVWVGTGEAVSGRHVAWGDGVYRSRNGGASWDRMGLEASEHIADVLIDPRDSDTVYVAAEGPLWSRGGERGVYKTTDGGESWDAVLEIDGDTGVTSLVFAPDCPDTLYAAAYQRRRHVATFVGGGLASGIHKSTDGGLTWRRISMGLPDGDIGKIGLAVTAADPSLVYATVEAAEADRGFYRSSDRGESWEKRNSYISGGTGPHYYQEIFASPVDADRVYQVDVFVHVTRDGGATFARAETGKTKHSDNHVVWIDPEEPDHLLVGTDGGLYETFDDCATFRHFPNLPISQFYRVAVDTSEPFTTVLAGAQDLGTLMGPSRTTNVDGVRNQDWTVPLGADGYHAAFDPTEPAICYLSWQEGNVLRFDRRTGELQDIQPQAADADPPERWNWDCPVVVSPHVTNRIYVASQRVWRSDDRGESWTTISGDLTQARNRYELATFGAVPSIDALYDHAAMSQFSTITHLCESAVQPGLIYAGTDEGQVHVTEDGGDTWRSCASIAGLPDAAFINNVVADHHDANAVFVAADDHKRGDYSPYLFRSEDRGRSWTPIHDDLPERGIVWCVEQDHVDPALLFAGTEFGLHTSVDGGQSWHRLARTASGDPMPTISFRDVAIQRRDDDLVCATFGRGIYVLDDYSALRGLDAETLEKEAELFEVRDAWWYVPEVTAQSVGQPALGSTAYRTPNPPFGAIVTYHLGRDVQGRAEQRRAAEKELRSAGGDVAFPGVAALREEQIESDPAVMLVIRNLSGEVIRQITVSGRAGLHRATWDLRTNPPQPVDLDPPGFKEPWERDPQGPLVAPGLYTAELVVIGADGALDSITAQHGVEVKAAPHSAGAGSATEAGAGATDGGLERTTSFDGWTAELLRGAAAAKAQLKQTQDRVRAIRETIRRTGPAAELLIPLEAIHRELADIQRHLVADPIAERLAEASTPTLMSILERVAGYAWNTTQPPTRTQRESVERAEAMTAALTRRLDTCRAELDDLAMRLSRLGGTWTP